MQRNVLSLVGVGLAGFLAGWLLMGWLIWPVAYTGEAYPYELNQADRLRYAQGAVDAFTLTGQVDPDWFAQWTPEEVSQALAQVATQPNRQTAAYSLGMRLGVAVQAKVTQDPTPVPLTVKLSKDQASEAMPFDWGIPLGIFGGIIVSVLVAGGVIFLTRRNRKPGLSQPQDTGSRYVEQQETRFTPLRQVSTTLAQTRLEFGPGLSTDQHFPIEGGGVHLGEFGVNQVDDQPAWDVWLFDQQAIVTVTKVLADRKSEELASRGEVIGWDGPFLLETSNLKMTGKASMIEAGLRVELTVEGKGE